MTNIRIINPSKISDIKRVYDEIRTNIDGSIDVKLYENYEPGCKSEIVMSGKSMTFCNFDYLDTIFKLSDGVSVSTTDNGFVKVVFSFSDTTISL